MFSVNGEDATEYCRCWSVETSNIDTMAAEAYRRQHAANLPEDFNADAEMPRGNYLLFFRTEEESVASINVLSFDHIRYCPGCCPLWHRTVWANFQTLRYREGLPFRVQFVPSTMHYGPGYCKHVVVVGPVETTRLEENAHIDEIIERLDLRPFMQL